MDRNRNQGSNPRVAGFSLLELMVVVAIIALLVAILLPSLQSARAHAKTTACATNLHSLGVAMATYLFSSNSTYPPSYAYPHDEEGNWDPRRQDKNHPYGYMHWSYYLYDNGEVNDHSFQCPTMDRGGAPRTNPGPDPAHRQEEQVDQNNGTSQLTDKQAPWMAYTANAAVMPRNKFTKDLSEGHRVNVFVRENQIRYPGATILATEFFDNWKVIGIKEADGYLSKSHRPINPFFHSGSGYNEYGSTPRSPGFVYTGQATEAGRQHHYGLEPTVELTREDRSNILDHLSGVAQINAVGRHHPTPKTIYRKKYGGSANFLFCDGHAENMTVYDSMEDRKWGNAYFGIDGENKILDMARPRDEQ